VAAAGAVTDAGPQQARREFGGELRAMRRRAGLTGDQIANQLGWSQPKVSKIETGKTMPTVADVRAFGEAAGAGRQELADLVGRFEELATQVTGWQVLLRSGIVGSQQRVAERDQNTTVSRQLTAVVPGLLQTAEYARSLLSGGPDPTVDVAAGVAARLDRQQVIYTAGKEFQFVLMEDLLRRLVTEPQVMAVQMDRVSQLSTLSNVRIGVVPQNRRLPLLPLHGFRIYDDELVTIELETGVVEVQSPADIAYYRRMFDALDEVADHGDDARRLLAGLAAHYRELAS